MVGMLRCPGFQGRSKRNASWAPIRLVLGPIDFGLRYGFTLTASDVI
jgi:hypothetical protein